jgi:RNA polymerase sigma-70 factor (ECF subfamily)
MRICANVARNRRRSMGRYFAALRRTLLNEPEPVNIAEHGMKNIDSQALWQAVRRLKHDDQIVIYLRYFLDMPEAEMAGALNVAQGTVKSRLHRALARLRVVVQRDFPGLHQEFET